jgi:hypothetical protein
MSHGRKQEVTWIDPEEDNNYEEEEDDGHEGQDA